MCSYVPNHERVFVSRTITNRCLYLGRRSATLQTDVRRKGGAHMSPEGELTGKRREILEFIESQLRDRGYPPSVREIGEAVGLTSSSTVHAHLATLQRQGYLRRDPTKPRAIEVRWDPSSGAHSIDRRPVRHVPLVGDVAAG